MVDLPPGRYVIDADGQIKPDSSLGLPTTKPPEEINGETSDGYHTFNELYDHRRALTAALLALVASTPTMFGMWSWRSRAHHPDDSPCYEGYFIVGIELPTGMVTYHYADQYWDDFQAVPAIPHAPKWDGAEPPLSVTRLIDYARTR